MNRNESCLYPRMLLVFASLLTVAGCSGPDGPIRYDLEGAVQYDGQPVPAGEVFLQPDASRGNAGPGSLALIKDGRYRTEPGKGIVGGAYVVRILGYDGVAVGDSATGKGLFPQYETQVEFPKEAKAHDFAIPRATSRGP